MKPIQHAKISVHPEAGAYEVGFIEYYGGRTPFAEVAHAFENQFYGHDELFAALFGDGVKVTATRAGFEVEEYSHD